MQDRRPGRPPRPPADPDASRRGDARRSLLAATALRLVGEGGLHALTHRAVDAALGLPTGSCSVAYRTRETLILAAVDHLFAEDRRALEAHRDATGRIDVLALMRTWTAADARSTLLARLEIFLAAARENVVRDRVDRHRAYFRAIAERTLDDARARATDDVPDDLLTLVDGELLRVATFTAPDEPYRPGAAFSRELRRYR